jgi:hypothetical protein
VALKAGAAGSVRIQPPPMITKSAAAPRALHHTGRQFTARCLKRLQLLDQLFSCQAYCAPALAEMT